MERHDFMVNVMAGKQAKILTKTQIDMALMSFEMTRHTERNRVLFLLSVKGGLRACECANLRWSMLMDANAQVSDVIALEDRIAKKSSGRTIPLNRDLKAALVALADQCKPSPNDFVIQSERGGPMSPNTVVHWFRRLYARLGFVGCSSHSGRRTAITMMARKIGSVGSASLRDIQEIVGHKSLQMTATYIQGDTQAKRKLVNLI